MDLSLACCNQGCVSVIIMYIKCGSCDSYRITHSLAFCLAWQIKRKRKQTSISYTWRLTHGQQTTQRRTQKRIRECRGNKGERERGGAKGEGAGISYLKKCRSKNSEQ